MVKNKSKNDGNRVKQNGPAKPPVQKRDMKTQTTRDFMSQITKAELVAEMEELESLEMKGLVTEYNGFKVRRPRPLKRDASTQIKRETLLAVREEVNKRGQSQVGPLIVAFKPKKRRPKYERPRPPQRSIKTQTSRDFCSQVTAVEIKETVAQAEEGKLRAVPNEYELTVENGDDGVIGEEWTLEIVDDAGLNATIVQDGEDGELIQNAEQNADSNGTVNPAFNDEDTSDINQVCNELESLAVESEKDSDEEYSTYL